MALKAVAKRAPVVVRVGMPLNGDFVDQTVFIADRAYEVERVDEVHATAGSDAGAVTLDVKKCTGTTAPASGTSVLASTFDLKSTADTVVSKTIPNGGVTSTITTRRLAAGDRISVDITGTTTACAGGVVVITLSPLFG